MSCDEVRDLLALFARGDLEEPEAEALALHLGGCEACRAEERAERALEAALGALPGTAPPEGFASRVGHSARGEARRDAWRARLRYAAAAGFAAALLAGVFFATRGGPSRPSDDDVIAHLDLLEQWDLLADADASLALDAPGDALLTLAPFVSEGG